jgi:hypothetical protein
MKKIGKLSVNRSNHNKLGPIVEVVVPADCTDVNEYKDETPITLRLSYETVAKLAKALNKLVVEQAKAVEDSYCGAI